MLKMKNSGFGRSRSPDLCNVALDRLEKDRDHGRAIGVGCADRVDRQAVVVRQGIEDRFAVQCTLQDDVPPASCRILVQRRQGGVGDGSRGLPLVILVTLGAWDLQRLSHQTADLGRRIAAVEGARPLP